MADLAFVGLTIVAFLLLHLLYCLIFPERF